MSLGSKPLESIEERDLQSLVGNQVSEGKTIEYKQVLPSNSDSDKKEFLADVSSFANASGGHLIYGIKEKSGVAVDIPGLGNIDPDAEILRLESMMRDAIEPRIPGVSLRAVSLEAPAVVILVRIPRSWASPHVVKFKTHWRFYSRTSAGRYPLDVQELGAAFALSEATAERIRNFRIERLSRIVAGETPIALPETAKIALHIVPLAAFDPAAYFDVSSLFDDVARLGPIYSSSWNRRHNFDGLLAYDASREVNYTFSYLQIFRNGMIEAVEADMLRPRNGRQLIPGVEYEKELLTALIRFVGIQKQIGVEPALFIMVTLIGVSGYTIAAHPSDHGPFRVHSIDRDTLIIPEVLLDSFEFEPGDVMRPIFDSVWNAAGWFGSTNYNSEGKWVERR